VNYSKYSKYGSQKSTLVFKTLGCDSASPTASKIKMRIVLADFRWSPHFLQSMFGMERKGKAFREYRAGFCGCMNIDWLYFHLTTGSRPCGSPPPFHFYSAGQDRTRMLLKDVTTDSDKQHLYAPGESACFCPCMKVWMCVCGTQKKGKHTVHASPVMTSASASAHSSHLTATFIQSDVVLLESDQKINFDPMLTWTSCFCGGGKRNRK